jgi:hypothetical protein
MIDLTKGNREFVVTTTVTRDGVAYMGPQVLVTARDHKHAEQVAREAGHKPNPHFGPEERKPWPRR